MSYIKKFLDENSDGGQHGSHYIYWVPPAIFNELNIKRWKFNRPADQDRVNAIRDYVTTSKRVDGMIYLALADNDLVCYDGNHRREAIKGVLDMNPVLVDVLWEATDKIVGEEFRRLNEAVSVPEYYNSIEADNAVRESIRNAIDMFCKNYKDHKVNSKNPHRPNFNRDVFCDDFYRIMTENNIGVEDLMSKLTKLNQEMMNRDKSTLPEKVVSKCEKSGLWLFAWSSRLNSMELV
jgi:hypothetical protein